VLTLGRLTLGLGLCTLAFGIWNWTEGNSWLLVLNGTACSTLGALLGLWRGPLAFRTVALLTVVMALSSGAYEFTNARLSRRVLDRLFLRAAGIASAGVGLAFLSFVFGWMNLDPSAPTESMRWLGSYFALSALCMLALIPSLYTPRLPQIAHS
jgi:hypothetical protein